MKRFKSTMIALVFSLTVLLPGAATFAMATASANSTHTVTYVAALKDDACAGLDQVNRTQGCDTGSKTFYKIVRGVVNILSFIIGVAAVIMIMVAGFRYITSGGEAGRVTAAKNALVYAMIGLAVAGLAQFLVRFVLNVSKV